MKALSNKRFLGTLLVLTSLAFPITLFAQEQTSPVEVFFSSDVAGELESCG